MFAVLEVTTGAIRTETTKLNRRVEFLEFMDKVLLLSSFKVVAALVRYMNLKLFD